MQNLKLGAALAAIVMGMSFTATEVYAQAQADVPNAVPQKRTHGYAARLSPKYGRYKPLTVAAPVAPPPPAGPALGAPVAAIGGLVTAPLNGLSQAFGFGAVGGPSRPLPIVAKYDGVGPVTDSVNQGWAQPVPVAANGPIYKLEPVSNSGTVSPFTLIAAPITAATTLATVPLNVAGAAVGAPPAPPPVF